MIAGFITMSQKTQLRCQWVRAGSPKRKDFKTQSLFCNVMATILGHQRNMSVVNFTKGELSNEEYYTEIVDHVYFAANQITWSRLLI